ncbi:MAG: sugar phosphate nucleotidyltransferase [Actinomycetota bacterium]
MGASLAGVALAAGAGTRLAPITDTIPKPLCTVAAETLLDLALQRLSSVEADPAVNVHHHPDLLRASVGRRAHVVQESPEALGTAGAIANLRPFIDGRPVVVVNGDTWCPGGLERLIEGWDGTSVRVFVPGGGDFGPRSPIVGTLLPWRIVAELEITPSGLYEIVWREEHAAGRLEVVAYDGAWVDCGTPADLLAANLAALGGDVAAHRHATVIGEVAGTAVGADALVLGKVTDSVLLAGAEVGQDEDLHRVIRWRAGGVQRTLQL